MVNFALSKFYKIKILITELQDPRVHTALWLTLGSKVYGIGFQPNKTKNCFMI